MPSSVRLIPVSFAFYQPDLRLKAWEKEDQRLKARGIAKKERPAEQRSALSDQSRIAF